MMQLIFTHENMMIIHNLKNILEQHDIACTVKNEFLRGAMGELAVTDCWPELYILNDHQFDAAKTLIEDTFDQTQ